MADAQQEFEQMLLTMSGSAADNNSRKAAEAAYFEQVASNGSWVLQALLHVGCNSADPAASQMALVLLGRLFAGKNLPQDQPHPFVQLGEEEQQHIKSTLLNFFGSTPQKLLRRAASNAIANLAIQMSSGGNDAWPDLWELLLKTVSSAEASIDMRAPCARIFGEVAPFLAKTYLRPHLRDVLLALQGCVQSGEPDLAKDAAVALAQLMGSSEVEDRPAIAATDILPNVFTAAGAFMEAGNQEVADEILQTISGIVAIDASLLGNHWAGFAAPLLGVAANANLTVSLRFTAVDLLVTYAEENPKWYRKRKEIVHSLLDVLFDCLKQVTISNEWAEGLDAIEANKIDDEDPIEQQAAVAIDTFSKAMRGKHVQERVTQFVQENIQAPAWEARCAALMALTYAAEGCAKHFLAHVEQIVPSIVLPATGDEHPRVRVAACQAVTQLSEDFNEVYLVQFAGDTLFALNNLLQDAVPHVREYAAMSIRQVLDDLEPDEEEEFDGTPEQWESRQTDYTVLADYLPATLQALIQALQSFDAMPMGAKLAFLTCTTTVVQSSMKLVTPYTTELVAFCQPLLSYPIDENAGKEQQQRAQLVRCTALEIITNVASFVGTEHFGPYVEPVCAYLLSLLQEQMEADDIRVRYVLRGWTAMVDCIGSAILPYLEQIFPPLLHVATQESAMEVTLTAAGEDEEKEEEGIEIIRRRNEQGKLETVKIKTSLNEDKELAYAILYTMTEKLKGDMAPVFGQLLEAATKDMGFLDCPEVRLRCAELCSLIIRTYAEEMKDEAQTASNFQQLVPIFLMEVKKESDLENVKQYLVALREMSEVAPVDSFPAEHLGLAEKILYELFVTSLDRLEKFLHSVAQAKAKAQRENPNGMESDDEEAIEQLEAVAEQHDLLLSEVAHLTGKLLKVASGFADHFQTQFLPLVSRLLDDSKPFMYHRLGLGLLTDMVEFVPAMAVQHVEHVTGALLHYMDATSNEDVYQTTVFGAGVAVEMLATNVPQPDELTSRFASQVADRMMSFLASPEAKKEDWWAAACNAVSSLLRILEALPGCVDPQPCLQLVGQSLPVRHDVDEEEVVNDRLVRWLADPQNPVHGLPAQIKSSLVYGVKQGTNMSEESKAMIANF